MTGFQCSENQIGSQFLGLITRTSSTFYFSMDLDSVVVPPNWNAMHKIYTNLITWIRSISASFNEHLECFV